MKLDVECAGGLEQCVEEKPSIVVSEENITLLVTAIEHVAPEESIFKVSIQCLTPGSTNRFRFPSRRMSRSESAFLAAFHRSSKRGF